MSHHASCWHTIGRLRSLGSSTLQFSFAEYSLFYRALLQKRLIILRSLLIIATPYVSCLHNQCQTVMPRQTYKCHIVMSHSVSLDTQMSHNVSCDIINIKQTCHVRHTMCHIDMSHNVTHDTQMSHNVDRKTPPPPGGFPIYYVPSSRTVCKRTPLEEPGTDPSRGVLLHTVLDEGT